MGSANTFLIASLLQFIFEQIIRTFKIRLIYLNPSHIGAGTAKPALCSMFVPVSNSRAAYASTPSLPNYLSHKWMYLELSGLGEYKTNDTLQSLITWVLLKSSYNMELPALFCHILNSSSASCCACPVTFLWGYIVYVSVPH